MNVKDGKWKSGSGDKGLTSLLPGSQVSKADERVDAIGGVEEAVAALGVVRAAAECPHLADKLLRIQKTLRTLTSGLADPRSGKFVFSTEEVEFLLSDMEKMLEKMPETDWKDALPGGCELSARLDMARAAARRAERAMIAMDRRYAVPETFKQYINRLGDWLLVAARYADILDKEHKATPAAPAEVASSPAAPTLAVPSSLPQAPVASEANDLVDQVLARLGMKKPLDLEKATRLISEVEAQARAQGRKAVVAVVNAEGNPVAVHVMDGAFLVSYEVAVKKAYTAVAVKMSTMELSKLVQPGQTFYGLQSLEKVVVFGGGVPLTVNGEIVGGLGVSGGTGEEDHALACFGLGIFQTLA